MTATNKVKLELTITVEYKKYATTIVMLRRLLKQIATDAYTEGKLTENYQAEVESFEYSIKRIHYPQ